MNLQTEIEKIKSSLHEALINLSLLDESNFADKFPIIRDRMQSVKNIKSKLIKNYSGEILKKFDEELFILYKQVCKKFDNKVEEFS